MKVKSKIIASIIIFVMTMPAMASSVNELDLVMKMVLMEKKTFDVSNKEVGINPTFNFKIASELPSIVEQSVNLKYKQDIAYNNSKESVIFSK